MIYSRFWPTLPIAPDMVAIDNLVFGTWVFWLGLAMVPFTALIADIAYKVIRKTQDESSARAHAHSLEGQRLIR